MDNTLGALSMPAPSASVVDRIRYLIKLSRMTQAQFAARTGVDASALSRMLSGHVQVGEAYINRLVVDLGVSKPWLTRGDGVPFPKDLHAKQLDVAGEGVLVRERSGAPVYDINVSAGNANLPREFTADRIVGYLNLPGVNPENPLVRVHGNSMSPRITDGSWVSLRDVTEGTTILWGQIYVIVLDDYRMVKYLRRHSDPEKVVLHSDNPDYQDIEVKRSDIRKLYLVEMILNYEIAL